MPLEVRTVPYSGDRPLPSQGVSRTGTPLADTSAPGVYRVKMRIPDGYTPTTGVISEDGQYVSLSRDLTAAGADEDPADGFRFGFNESSVRECVGDRGRGETDCRAG